MKTINNVWVFTSLLIGFSFTLAYPHGGRTNSDGCHTKKSTGQYHCHNGSSKSSSKSFGLLNSSSGSYRNCKEARAAGVTPLRRGDPGYSKKLDRDRDGIACE